jgi:hypothetical protein
LADESNPSFADQRGYGGQAGIKSRHSGNSRSLRTSAKAAVRDDNVKSYEARQDAGLKAPALHLNLRQRREVRQGQKRPRKRRQSRQDAGVTKSNGNVKKFDMFRPLRGLFPRLD